MHMYWRQMNFNLGLNRVILQENIQNALNKIIQYYINNKSDVYVLILDCSKAFD